MPITIIKTYTRKLVQSKPATLFVFGDNMRRYGMGGQAAECRGEPNAVGIPTKWMPAKHPSAYFCNEDMDQAQGPIDEAFERLEQHLQAGGEVAWPQAGVGTGLANLANCAPQILAYIQARYERLLTMEAAHG